MNLECLRLLPHVCSHNSVGQVSSDRIVAWFPNDLNGLNVLNYLNVSVASPYYLVSAVEYRLRNRQTNLLGRFQVDHQLEFRWSLDGKIGRLGAFENLIHVRRRAPVKFGKVGVRRT